MNIRPSFQFLSMLLLSLAASYPSTAQTTSPAVSPTLPTTLPTTRPTTRPAAKPSPRPTFVLVHGAWAGGWEWKKVGTLLQERGHTVYRPTLTGQGERVHLASAEVDLNTHIQDIVNVILFEDLHDVVLMGHSYGGMVVTGVADRVPDRIRCLVYVDAFLPEDGESVNSLGGKKFPAEDGMIPPPGKPPAADRKPPYIVPMSAKIFDTPETLKNPEARNIPAAYILCTPKNGGVEKAAFRRFYDRATDAGFFVTTIQSDHVVNQSHPRELADLLEEAQKRASRNP